MSLKIFKMDELILSKEKNPEFINEFTGEISVCSVLVDEFNTAKFILEVSGKVELNDCDTTGIKINKVHNRTFVEVNYYEFAEKKLNEMGVK